MLCNKLRSIGICVKHPSRKRLDVVDMRFRQIFEAHRVKLHRCVHALAQDLYRRVQVACGVDVVIMRVAIDPWVRTRDYEQAVHSVVGLIHCK